MRFRFAFVWLAIAGCGGSSTDQSSLEVGWQQPLARTDVCSGGIGCAWAWVYGDPPRFEIAPFTAPDYELTLAIASDRDVQEGATTMTFHGDAGQCDQFVGRIDWSQRPPAPRDQLEPFAFHVDAHCSDDAGLHVIADVRGLRDDRPPTTR